MNEYPCCHYFTVISYVVARIIGKLVVFIRLSLPILNSPLSSHFSISIIFIALFLPFGLSTGLYGYCAKNQYNETAIEGLVFLDASVVVKVKWDLDKQSHYFSPHVTSPLASRRNSDCPHG